MESVDVLGQSLRTEMRQMRDEIHSRFEVLEAAVRQNGVGIRQMMSR